MKAFLVGFATGAAATIGAYLYMAGVPELARILLAAAPHILVTIAVAALIVILVPFVQLLKNRHTSGRIIESAKRQAATILADAEKARLTTAQQVALLNASRWNLSEYIGRKERNGWRSWPTYARRTKILARRWWF